MENFKHGQKRERTLQVEIQNDAGALENSLIISEGVKQTAALWPGKSTPRYVPERKENIFHTKPCIQVFVAALFIITPKWK